MGGDGGVIASNRKYMRGAGTADHTGDLGRHGTSKFDAREVMSTCALTKSPLLRDDGGVIVVADPYGSLYHKEAAVRALLKRKQQQQQQQEKQPNGGNTAIGHQVRRLGDLYEVRFHRDGKDKSPACPISGKALTGSISAVLLVPGKPGMPNVVGESALSMLSKEELEEEHGTIERRVRLAPNPVLLETIKKEVEEEHEKDEEERRRAKKEKKDKKQSKRKREGRDKKTGGGSDKNKNKRGRNEKATTSGAGFPKKNTKPSSLSSSSSSSLGQVVQSTVDSAIEQNSVLSSLFTNKNAASKVSEKEKRDNLFAR